MDEKPTAKEVAEAVANPPEEVIIAYQKMIEGMECFPGITVRELSSDSRWY